MSLFGKSESELKKIAEELDKRQVDLANLESTLNSNESTYKHKTDLLDAERQAFELKRDAFLTEVKKQREEIVAESSSIEQRRIELVRQEAAAKAQFIGQQRADFHDLIEKRQAELDAREKELDSLEERLTDKSRALHQHEADLAKRRLAVTEREQKADAGFADKINMLAEEAGRQQQANVEEASRLKQQADALIKERDQLEIAKAELVKRERSIILAEQACRSGFADERAALDNELRELRGAFDNELRELRGAFSNEQRDLREALDNELRDQRARVESQITERRERQLSALEEELLKLRGNRLEEVGRAESAERERIRAELVSEIELWTRQQEDARKRLEVDRAELEKQKGAVSALQSELEGRRVELEQSEKTLESRNSRLERQWQKRNDTLDQEIANRLDDERASMESIKLGLKEENDRLRESLRVQMDLVSGFDQLKRQLGNRDAAEIIRDLNSKSDELRRLREELVTRPTEGERERYKEISTEVERLRSSNMELTKRYESNLELAKEANEYRRKNSELEADKSVLSQRASRFEGAANEAQAELDRLRAAYERPAELAARHKEIEQPHIKAAKIKVPPKKAELKELEWLKRVETACDDYGIHFPQRILKAFHTSLKTAEWSPVTILAGVSGTGKSELPRLYSHFGGLMFESLSVQPNWDSQESMLGFFNSIDNKFDAQPVLRFLAQSQKPWEETYPGLQDAVCLVLLDEMNLAHPELYFAEFLSKFEFRRGMKGTDVPALPVKVGSGLEPYQLPLGRNVLWTGTMNQDETTKSLSDKVLDRSIIIHFPRPTELKRRLALTPLDEKNRGPLLHKADWNSWLSQKTSFNDEDVKPFKDFIQNMNKSLGVVGRAIGHRVWQSVEYYMANYPDVKAAQDNKSNKSDLEKALHTAFEDQLVQKIMPKLRGIDTRGKSKTECLDKIRSQITIGIGETPFNLAEDFDLACDLGYGQFIWQSANYLREISAASSSQAASSAKPDESATSKDNADISTPPDNYYPESPDRDAQWNQLSMKQKRIYMKNAMPK